MYTVPCVCRLLRLSPECAKLLVEQRESLDQFVESAQTYSDVYRYWDAIQYLLSRHQPESIAANWLTVGEAVSIGSDEIPSARLISPDQVSQINAALQQFEPDDLIPYYDAGALDAASVYPQCWKRWEETFDPLGQVLEHYWFLKQFAASCAASGDALLLCFEFVDDGSDGFDDDDSDP
jgi:hypothetical protein